MEATPAQEEAKAAPTQNYNDTKFLADEQRYIVKTNNGIIDQDMVGKFREAHVEA